MNKKVYKVAIVICAITLLLSAGVLFLKWWKESRAEDKFRELSTMQIESETEEPSSEEVDVFAEMGLSVPENTYDWEALKKENEHIYAWIVVPNTNVDYPVFQHPTDDSYYLNHNMDGSTGYPGCIYSEATYNALNFQDYHTVLYGHNMKNGTMFKTLQQFQDKTFFDENRYIYVFTPEGTYVYEIFAAYTGSNEHLLTNYSRETEGQHQTYLEYAVSTAQKTGRFCDDVSVCEDDCILTLSTCIGDNNEKRYIVSGVLIVMDVSDAIE